MGKPASGKGMADGEKEVELGGRWGWRLGSHGSLFSMDGRVAARFGMGCRSREMKERGGGGDEMGIGQCKA
jgi:hypothetical protein